MAKAQDVITTLDILVRDPAGAMRQHYILIAVQCRWISGEPVAGRRCARGALVSDRRSSIRPRSP